MARTRLLDSLRRLLGHLGPERRRPKAGRGVSRVAATLGDRGLPPSRRVEALKAGIDDSGASVAEAAALAAAEVAPGAEAPVAVAPAAATPIVPASTPSLPAAAAMPAAPAAAAPSKTMRSLEEVRADLARLRENAKQRHAQLQVRREATAFAPTDFMDFTRVPEALPSEPVPLLPPAREGGSDGESFAATAFLDFTNIKAKPRPGR